MSRDAHAKQTSKPQHSEDTPRHDKTRQDTMAQLKVHKTRFFSKEETNLPVEEEFHWDLMTPEPLTAQKGDGLAGYEWYTPLTLQVATHKARSQFGMGRGKASDDAKASASGMAMLGGTQVGGASTPGTIALAEGGARKKRAQFETDLTNNQANHLIHGAAGVEFKKWFVKHWDVLMKNVELFDDCTTPQKRMELLNGRNYLRSFVKEKSAKAKKNYPHLAKEPFTLRRKMIERKGRFQSQLWRMLPDNTMMPGRAEDIKPFCQVQDFCTFHMIINDEHLELLLISRTAAVFPEVKAPTVDVSSMFGGTIVTEAPPAMSDMDAAAAAAAPAPLSTNDSDDVEMVEDSTSTLDTNMMEVGGAKVSVAEAMALAM